MTGTRWHWSPKPPNASLRGMKMQTQGTTEGPNPSKVMRIPKSNGEDVCSGHEITESPHTVAHKHVSELAVDILQVNQALEALHSDTSRFPQSKDQSQHLGSRNGFRQSHDDRLPSQRCSRGTRGCVHEAPCPLPDWQMKPPGSQVLLVSLKINSQTSSRYIAAAIHGV